MYNKKHLYGAVSLHPSRKYDQSFYWRILPWNQFSCAAAACVHACAWCVCVVCVCVCPCVRMVCVWSRERFCGVSVAGRCGGFGSFLRVSLLASAGQAGAAVAALEDLQTLSSFPPVTRAHLPLVSTGLQIRDQKCRAQQSPSTQSEPETRLALATWQIIHHISVHLCEIKHVWSTGSFEFRRVNLRRDETTARWKKCGKAGWGFYFGEKRLERDQNKMDERRKQDTEERWDM